MTQPTERPSPRPAGLTTCRGFDVGGVRVGGSAPLALIAGPCVIESEDHILRMAEGIRAVAERLGVPLIFKASYDKANRTSFKGFRGPGLAEGLRILARAKRETGLPVLTDVHTEEQVPAAAEVCDILQVPAFLCRQTDFIYAMGRGGKPVNVKKGQFLAPHDIRNVVAKLREAGCEDILLTERGASFGYNTLVSDFRGLPTMQELTGLPVCFDATHSVQQPGGAGEATGGERKHVATLARAAAAVGINALFMEVHDHPPSAKSDGPNQVWLDDLEDTLRGILAVDAALRAWHGSPAPR
ncbi:MAG: 3-deoxy-8-phosphooctulonate synthase [Candidatus Sumerlaeia bacterium]|nr:3-deoxy-8-phosphooctulonate synthase [Candidatus Sumerlaeia bacterium]